ncbi:MAG TPA: hypothetical protein VIS99_08025 [Terrimicrobiaceae bacterium]
MKYRALITAITIVACVGTGSAQRSDESSRDSDTRFRDKDHSRFLESLSPEMRERFQSAREKALEDPKLQELRWKAQRAKREFFKAMRESMLKIDPGLAEIVKKKSVERRARRLSQDEERFRNLNDPERQKLLKVVEQVESDPAVQAARKRKWEANSADEHKTAVEAYNKILQDAMMKVDPTIAPILDKLGTTQAASPSPANKD